MNPLLFTNALGSIGFFSSRIFLPALMTALLLRFGAHIPLLDHAPLIFHAQHTPTWFTSNACITVLLVLSILEVAAQKNADARRLLHEFDVSAKAVMALLTTFGVASTEDTKFIQQTIHQAGFTSAAIPALIAVIGTVGVGQVRGRVMSMLHDMDPEDLLHLQHLISWAEDAWVVGGVIILLLSPVIAVIGVVAMIGLLEWMRRRLAAREELRRIGCVQCGEMIYPCATACFRCRTAVAHPHAIGFLGQSKPDLEDDLENHPMRLLEKKRCPVCATHLKARTPHQTCAVCSTPIANAMAPYTPFITRRLPGVLTVAAALSAIPLLGMVIGTVYYRMLIVNPFMVYLPLGKRFLLRWGIRILFVLLTFFQLVPVVGIIVVPLMAVISHFIYRAAFDDFLAGEISEPLPAVAPA